MKYISHLVLLFCCVVFSQHAHAMSAEQTLLHRISQAEKTLSHTQAKIVKQRQTLAKQMYALEREVMQLREKTAVARRMQDENSLSLSTLQQRLDSWQKQHHYQANLLSHFLQRFPQHMTAEADLPTQLAHVNQVVNQLGAQLHPDWQTRSLVMPNGEINTLPTLQLGPVIWFIDSAHQQAGIASSDDPSQLSGEVLLSGDSYHALTTLHHSGQGQITLDPTLSRALAREQSRETLYQHLKKGGLWVVPIMVFALVALCIALLKSIQLFRLPRIVSYAVTAAQSSLQLQGAQRKCVEIAAQYSNAQQRDDQLFAHLQTTRSQLERWIGAIAITASVSPLLGLLGTVSGMIETFKMMTLFGAGDPEVVSGGIAQALVTTELGLVVAIPSLVVSALLSRRAKSYYQQLETFAITLSNRALAPNHEQAQA